MEDDGICKNLEVENVMRHPQDRMQPTTSAHAEQASIHSKENENVPVNSSNIIQSAQSNAYETQNSSIKNDSEMSNERQRTKRTFHTESKQSIVDKLAYY